jgi:tetratricopeptide (TPR) repeat protein
MRYVFPEVRSRLESQGIIVRGMDLRWGIPKDFPLSTILDSCLSRIDDCSPYFIGLIGDNLGTWVSFNSENEQNPGFDLLFQKFPQIKEVLKAGIPITLLEFYYAVIQNQIGEGHLFYFRAGEHTFSLDSIPALKHVLRKDLFKTYTSDDLREVLVDDILNVIAPSGIDKQRTITNKDWFDFYQSKLEVKLSKFYINREPYISSLNDFMKSGKKAMVIFSKGCYGKSSLLSNFLHTIPESFSVYRFIDDKFDYTAKDILGFLAKEIGGEEWDDSEYSFFDDIYGAFLAILHKVSRYNDVIIALDSSRIWEQGSERAKLVSMIVSSPSNIHFIITMQEEVGSLFPFFSSMELDSIKRDILESIIIEILRVNGKEKEAKSLYPLLDFELFNEVRCLKTALNYLLLFSNAESLQNDIIRLCEFNKEQEFISFLLEDVANKVDQIIVERVLPLLWYSSHGLPEQDLLLMSGCPSFVWRLIYNIFEDYFIFDGVKVYLSEKVSWNYHWNVESERRYRKEIIDFYTEDLRKDQVFAKIEVAYQIFSLTKWSDETDYTPLYSILKDIECFEALKQKAPKRLYRYWKVLKSEGFSPICYLDDPDISLDHVLSVASFLSDYDLLKDQAKEFYQFALKNESLSKADMIRINGNIASYYQAIKQYDHALECYHAILADIEAIQFERRGITQAYVLCSIGDALKSAGKLSDAIEMYREAIESLGESPNEIFLKYNSMTRFVNCYCDIHPEGGGPEIMENLAGVYAEEALRIATDFFGIKSRNAMFALTSIAKYRITMKRDFFTAYNTAYEYLKQADYLAKAYNAKDKEREIALYLARVLKLMHREDEMNEYGTWLYREYVMIHGRNHPKAKTVLDEGLVIAETREQLLKEEISIGNALSSLFTKNN